VRNIVVLAALLFGFACARPVEPARPRVIFVGLDGADWQLLDRLADGSVPARCLAKPSGAHARKVQAETAV
jgi:hypothetical protein